MSHDIEAINAALRLGDKFFWPVGTICRIYQFRRYSGLITFFYARVLGLVKHKDGRASIAIRRVCKQEGKWLPYHLEREAWSPSSLGEAAFIPDEAPPFEEWERP